MAVRGKSLVALWALPGLFSFLSCTGPKADQQVFEVADCPCTISKNQVLDQNRIEPCLFYGKGALLASRFASLDELKSVVQIEYLHPPGQAKRDSAQDESVRLTHCSNGKQVVTILNSGISQKDFMQAKAGTFWDRVGLGFRSIYTAANRRDLQRMYLLARRRPEYYGHGDVAFFDLAETSVENISTPEQAFLHPNDSSEKGFLNTFNHVTAQAVITTFFSEDMADFVADVHERYSMPELLTGEFRPEQLSNFDKNPVDNYVDMINNEWGQELGKELASKYHINATTICTPELLANYLNDIQQYYGWAFQIGFDPYSPQDEVVLRFTQKLNLMRLGGLPKGDS